jgi:hypothetical protein
MSKNTIKPALNQFNGGEISPQLEGRFDWDKYNYSAKLCKNFIPLVEGSLKRRGGTHFVGKTEDVPVVSVTFKFSFNDIDESGDIPSIEGRIDDTTSVISEREYSINVEYGTVLDYSFYSDGYVSLSGNIEAIEDVVVSVNFIRLTDIVTLTIETDPKDATCLINGVETKQITVEKNTVCTVVASYKNHTVTETYNLGTSSETKKVLIPYVAYKSYWYEKAEEVYFERGYYHVTAIGGSGGAGGGTYGDNRKSTGGGGGSGACYLGNIKLEGLYTVNAARGGAGGYNGKDSDKNNNGGDGTATYISGVISLGGGKGGSKGKGKSGNGDAGNGGVYTIYDQDAVLSIPHNGNAGKGTKGGVTALFTNYKGGDGVYKKTGKAGSGGYLLIEYNGSWK